jgi:hypothetical protein
VANRWTRRFWNWITLTPLRTLVAGILTLVLVAGLVVGSYTLVKVVDSCGSPGMYHRGPAGECTGVTDGGFVFASQLRPIERAILRENQNIKGQYVTVALLLPMTDPDPAMQTEVLHAVEGAYAAQYRGNNDGQAPFIKLVLANPGVASAEYLPVAQQLAAMTGSQDNLRAVVGISVSTEATKLEIGWLTEHGIPVVGGAITADDIANTNTHGSETPYPGLARVEPTNSQEAVALTHFGNVNPKQAILVEDTRTDDDYITTLAQAFTKVLTGSPYQPFQFTSPPAISQNGDTSNTFLRMAPNICGSHVKWIYFAGRQVQLRQFINELSANCQGQDFTIVTGSAASHLATDAQLDRQAFSRGISLVYTAIASPGAWTSNGTPLPTTGGSPGEYQSFVSALENATGSTVALDDGQAIINYDAAWTAISGIQLATVSGIPSLTAVATGWHLLEGHETVLGASGWICLDNAGNPYDKAVPIVRFNPQGVPQFITNEWPNGAPPPKLCIP